jgi:hypothetical protein
MTRYAYGRIKSLLFKLEHELRQSLYYSMGMLELAAEEPLPRLRRDICPNAEREPIGSCR